MKKFLCRIFGHDRMVTNTRNRVCLRCGQRETQRYFGTVMAWEEVAATGTSEAKRRGVRPSPPPT